MKTLIKEIGNWIKRKIVQFKNSRFFMAVTMFVIGATSVIIYYEGLSLYNYIETGLSYTKVVLQRTEEAPQEGEVAEAGSYGKELKEGSTPSQDGIEALTTRFFGSDAKIALAVFKTESGLNPTAMNWNCRYNGRSQQCKPEDRGQAWSVDCGIAQINVVGKDCPEELFVPEKNIERAYAMFQKRGFQPWVSYVNNYHLANL